MTQDEIIRMAREAGLLEEGEAWVSPHQEAMERFAALVAAHEREVYAGRVEVLIQKQFDECEAAVLAEREACAKVCEKMAPRTVCAAAIRARGEE